MPATPAGKPVVPLPDGPGLTSRWVVAVPLMVLAAFGPWVGALVLATWTDLATGWQQAILPAAVTAGFLLWRNRMTSWPTACFVVALFTVGLGLLVPLAVDDLSGSLPDIAFGVAIIWLGYEVGRLAEYVLSRPVAADVVGSRLEISFRLPGQRPRLRVQDARLVLDRLGGLRQGSTSRVVIPWRALVDVRVEDQREDTTWTPVGRRTRSVEVPAGPAVRIEGRDQTWLLPAASELVARNIVAVITARAHIRPLR